VAGLILFDRSTDGHRGRNLAVLQRELGGSVVTGVSFASFVALIRANRVLFATAEGAPAFTAAVTALRAATFRPTVLLAFRAHYSLGDRTAKGALRRSAWRVARALPRTTALSIVPGESCPGITRVVDGTIFDPQWWDIDTTESPDERYAARVREAAAGRLVIASMGVQSREKGVPLFFRLWEDERLRERFLFAAIGQLSPGLEGGAGRFRELGGWLDDRVVSDAELLGGFDAASLVWTCYDPAYDQSSGIFGRAIQLGIPVASRAGSLVERLMLDFGHGCSLPGDDAGAAAEALLAFDGFERRRRADVEAMRRQSVERLRLALRMP
jgi:hypothetical protein